jgi:CheY-like chemotaxis protein
MLRMTEEVSTPHAAYVLVVDDDEGILRLARKSLERAGCRVAICAGVDVARERLASGTPDLLVLDYQLSGPETGLDFFRRLRAEGVRIPAILVTGFTDESRVIEALRAGVSDVVPKSAITWITCPKPSSACCRKCGCKGRRTKRYCCAIAKSITARCRKRCRTSC